MTTTPLEDARVDPETAPDTDPGGPESSSRRAHFQIYAAQVHPVTGRAAAHWRLLSGNHRELGRSATPTQGAGHAALDIEDVRRRLTTAQAVVRPVAGHRWEWRLVDAGGTLAVSGHAFDRKLRCVRAAEQFVLLAPTAPVADNVIATDARRGARAARGVARQV